MRDAPNLIAILPSDPEQLAEWGDWLAAAGFEIYPAADVLPAALPEGTALVVFCRKRLAENPDLIKQLRARLPLAPLLCATSTERAAEALAAGADDIVTDPLSAPVLQNRVRQMLPRAASFTETIQRTAAALVGPHTLPELLELVLRQIKLVMPRCNAANVVVLGNDGDEMIVAHHAGYFDTDDNPDQTVLRKFERRLSDLPHFQRMVKTREPLLIGDRAQAADWVPMPGTDWVRCYVGAPIVVQDAVIGFINVDSATPGAFSVRQARQLQSFAYHVGVALYHTRLVTQLRAATERLEDTVAARTEELMAERARLQIILDSIGEGVVYYDAPAHPVFINHAMVDLFGHDPADWLAGRVQVAPDNITEAQIRRLDEQVERALARFGVWQISGPVRRADGSTFEAQVTVRPDADDRGRVVVYRDISQEKALMERQARFVAYASHELRTPITNIQTQLYLVRRRPERADHHLGVIEEVVARMNTLVENLLTLSRLGNGGMVVQMAAVDLREVLLAVHRVQGAEAARANIRLALALPGAPLLTTADYERLVQVLTNLTVNALSHTAGGRQVTLRLGQGGTPPAGDVHSNPALFERGVVDTVPAWAALSVQDEGTGIAPDHLPHLFQPFYRASEQYTGTGLGLTIAAEIARLHGGTLTVESEPGRGSTFCLWLPLAHVEETTSR